MIGLEDRQEHARDIEAACKAGARLHEACEVVGITARTLQRWRAHKGLESGDGRPNAVRLTRRAAWSALSSSCTSKPTILRL